MITNCTDLTAPWDMMAKQFFQDHLEPRVQVALSQHQELLQVAQGVEFTFTAQQVLSGEALRAYPLLAARIPGVEPIGNSPVLASPHYVDPETGLHICGKPLLAWFGDGRSAEELLYALWTGVDPTSDQSDSMCRVLKCARESLDFPYQACLEALKVGLFPLLARHEVPPLQLICEHVALYLSATSGEHDVLIRGNSPEIEVRFLEWVRAITVLSILVPFALRLFSDSTLAIEDFAVPNCESFGEVYALGFGVDRELAGVFDMLTILMAFHGSGNGSSFTGRIAMNFNTTVSDALRAGFAVGTGISHCGAASVCAFQMSKAAQSLSFAATEEELISWFENQGAKIYAVGHALLKGDNEDPRAVIARDFLSAHYHDNEWVTFASTYFKAALNFLSDKSMGFLHCNVDAFTAVILRCIGVLKSDDQATLACVIFLLSRTCGIAVEGFWDQALSKGRGIVPRPKTLSVQTLLELKSRQS